MRAKLFDPFHEDAVNAWLATTPVKVIHSAHMFENGSNGSTRQVALVFYEEEHELGLPAPSAFWRSIRASSRQPPLRYRRRHREDDE